MSSELTSRIGPHISILRQSELHVLRLLSLVMLVKRAVSIVAVVFLFVDRQRVGLSKVIRNLGLILGISSVLIV